MAIVHDIAEGAHEYILLAFILLFFHSSNKIQNTSRLSLL